MSEFHSQRFYVQHVYSQKVIPLHYAGVLPKLHHSLLSVTYLRQTFSYYLVEIALISYIK